MKKTKLLVPILGIATLSSAVIPMVGCSCKNGIKIKPELSTDTSTGVLIKDSNIVKGKESTITLTIPDGKEMETLEVTIGNKLLTKGTDYTFENNIIKIKADVVTGENVTVKVIVKDKVVAVESVSLNKDTLTLTEGQEETLTATVLPEGATDKTVTWDSSNKTVATVTNGKVIALFEGTTTITVKTNDGNKTATCVLTVNPKTYDNTVIFGEDGKVYEADMGTVCDPTESEPIKGTELGTTNEKTWPRNEFNCKIRIGKNYTVFGDGFLTSCGSFNQPIIIPNTVTSIGPNFLCNDMGFNSKLTFAKGSTITNIAGLFMSGCGNFKNTIDLSGIANPDQVTIGNKMLQYLGDGNTISFVIAQGTSAAWRTKLQTATGKATLPETWTITEAQA